MGKQKVQKQKMMVKAKTSIKRTVKKTKHKRDELEKNRPAKRHSPDKYRDTDAPATKTNQYTSNLPPSNKHVGVDKLRQFHSLVTNSATCSTKQPRSHSGTVFTLGQAHSRPRVPTAPPGVSEGENIPAASPRRKSSSCMRSSV